MLTLKVDYEFGRGYPPIWQMALDSMALSSYHKSWFIPPSPQYLFATQRNLGLQKFSWSKKPFSSIQYIDGQKEIHWNPNGTLKDIFHTRSTEIFLPSLDVAKDDSPLLFDDPCVQRVDMRHTKPGLCD